MRIRSLLRRGAPVAAAAMALSSAAVVSAPAAEAAITPGCRTIIRTLSFQEGSVSVDVGNQRLTLSVCWDSSGSVSSSDLAHDTYATGAGTAAGYSYTSLATYPSGSSSGGRTVTWYAPVHAQACIAGRTPVCGFSEDFLTTVTYYAPGFVGPLPSNQQGATFKAKCTMSTCKFRFKNET